MRTALRAEEPPITGHDFLSQREIRAYITNCLSARALVHSLLARLTGTHPSAEFLGAIPLDLYRTLLPLVPPLGDVLTAVAGCLDDAGALRNAEEEYRGLYVGPNPLPAPLWESVHRDPEHSLFARPALEVRAFYARYGLAFKDRRTEPDDHISLECEFMACLAAKANAAFREKLFDETLALVAGQRAFLEEHLLLWAPQAFALQLPRAETPLYRATAGLIVAYMPADLELLLELQKTLENHKSD